MTQKTIKALYKQPVNYKLIKDGYKTINGVIQAQDDMPKVVDLPVPSELYTTDLQYNVNTEVNGAPIITTEQFTLPDNEICEAKEYCYAPKGINYNYTTKQNVRHYDNFTVVGSPTVTSAGIASGFTTDSYIQLIDAFNPANNSWEVQVKFTTSSDVTTNQQILHSRKGTGNSGRFGIGLSFENTHFNFYCSSDGSNWSFDLYGTYTILTNTTYWLKIGWDGAEYYLEYSLDGETYTRDITNASTSAVYSPLTSSFIGVVNTGSFTNAFDGSIDLSKTYIKINDEIWWVPYTYHKEEITTQISGILDSSVTTDNWQQSQEYKLYQLKNQNNTDSLQLTENNITDTIQKYKQYIGQLTIPARDYKWYYHSIPQSSFIYRWYANKSLYDYIENEIYADTLNFSNSWVNVTNDWETQRQYVNPEVCLMPIDGGETIITYPLNATEIGNTNFNTYTGIANRFSSDDYLQLLEAFNPGENPWEMIIKIRTGADLQIWQEIFHSSVAPNIPGRFGLSVMLDSGTFELDISTDGSSWMGSSHGTFALSEDADYWVKVGWNSNEYYLEYSTNGVDYIRDITYTSSNHLPNLTNSWIGIYRNSSYMYPMFGTIDLSESYIKINNEIWWQGASSTAKEHQYIITKDALNITNYETATVNDGVISDITESMTTNNSITIYKDKPFEIFGRIKTGSNTSGIQEIFTDYGSNLFLLRNSGTYWNVCYYVNGSWQQTTNGGFYSNTSYLIRLRYFPTATTKDGFSYSAKTIYFEYLKENDSGWTRDYSYSLATYFFGNDASVTSQTFNMTIGSQSGAELWTGSIDLNKCYIKVDGKIVWKGINFKETINGCIAGIFTDEGQEHQFDVYYDSSYTQPILVSTGESYSEGTKVDTITIPAHKTWNYQAGGTWLPITYVDTTTSNYTYEDGNLVLTEYTGNETDVTLPNAVL